MTFIPSCANLQVVRNYEIPSTESYCEAKSITVENNAEEKESRTSFMSDSRCYLNNLSTKTKMTIEEDMRNFFEKNCNINDKSNIDLTITINEANSYMAMTAADTTPFISLATMFSDSVYGMDIEFLFEIEQDGKVIKNYNYKKTIKIEDGDPNNIGGSYERLLVKYSEIVFTEIDNKFIRRYF
jgi:hypothetical protein